MEENTVMRKHRVGAITFGCSLVVFGGLFLVHAIVPALSYSFIFRLWPCMFILLGVEILVSNRQNDTEFVYDKGALFMVIIMTLFAMGMAFADWAMQMAQLYPYW